MADMEKLSRQLVDYAERFADMTDAAKGRGPRNSGIGTRWLILPAAGAGLYALFTSNRTKGVMEGAKARASELPEDLVNRVRQTSQSSSGGGTTRKSSQNGSSSRSRPKRRTGSSSRKSTSSR
jgi:hypothetical protein